MWLIAACLGCAHPARQLTVDETSELRDDGRAKPTASAPAWFSLKSIDGDRAFGTIEYVGGCKPHTFRIVTFGFLESYPVQVHLTLVDESDDTCTTKIRERVEVNLEPLKRAYMRAYGTRTGVIDLGHGEQLYRF
jgi:hypothetical protein